MSIRQTDLWRLLLVDDDHEDYLIFKELLKSAQGRNISLEWASTYELGEQLLSANRYDAVFVDYHLGKSTGIHLIRKIVEREYPAPIILLTGLGSYEVDLEAMEAGATYYLTKDEINAFSLERFIRYAIERKLVENELREQAVQIELHHRLLEHRDQERQRIARELHDGPIQDLLALLMDVRYRQDMVTNVEMKNELNTLEAGLNNAVQSIRNMINEIRPPNLVQFGLSRAIQIYLNDFKCKHPDIELNLTLMDDEACLSEQARLNVFRILQESLANVVKHANTKRIEVSWLLIGQHAVLKIRDEGKGFTIADSLLEYSACGHYGLVGMKERADAIGAQFSIESQTGSGTITTVFAPTSN